MKILVRKKKNTRTLITNIIFDVNYANFVHIFQSGHLSVWLFARIKNNQITNKQLFSYNDNISTHFSSLFLSLRLFLASPRARCAIRTCKQKKKIRRNAIDRVSSIHKLARTIHSKRISKSLFDG